MQTPKEIVDFIETQPFADTSKLFSSNADWHYTPDRQLPFIFRGHLFLEKNTGLRHGTPFLNEANYFHRNKYSIQLYNTPDFMLFRMLSVFSATPQQMFFAEFKMLHFSQGHDITEINNGLKLDQHYETAITASNQHLFTFVKDRKEQWRKIDNYEKFAALINQNISPEQQAFSEEFNTKAKENLKRYQEAKRNLAYNQSKIPYKQSYRKANTEIQHPLIKSRN